MPYLHDDVFDNGLSQLSTYGDKLMLCSQEPANYTEATSTYDLGYKDSPTINAPTNGDSSGRKVAIDAISSGGTIIETGSATHWAIVDVSATKLLAAAALGAGQNVTSGNQFTLTTFDIEMPDPS